MPTRVLVVNPGVRSQLFDAVGKPKKPNKPWMPPGSLPDLAAMILKANPKADVVLGDEVAEGAVASDFLEAADVIMISGLTPSRYRTLDLARIARALGKPFIVGGRDVIGWFRDAGADELLKEYDAICPSRATSELMAQILSDAANGRLEGVYAVPDEICEFVIPRRDLLKGRYFGKFALRSSDGCKLRCPWCTVGGRGFFAKPIDMLEAEVKSLRWPRILLDNCDSFASDPDHTMDVIRVYREAGARWGTEITPSELLGGKSGISLVPLMAKAGCRLLYLGVESIFRRYGKSDRALAEEAIRQCRKAGITVIVALILDAMGDETAEMFLDTARWAAEWADFVQLSLIALLPGCALAHRRVCITGDHERFDGAHATMDHDLSAETREKLLRQCYLEFLRTIPVWRRIRRAPLVMKPLLLLGNMRYRAAVLP